GVSSCREGQLVIGDARPHEAGWRGNDGSLVREVLPSGLVLIAGAKQWGLALPTSAGWRG
ncbi:MAG: hypothetical protein V1750_04075, partial [Acidobacteriota bacterium]